MCRNWGYDRLADVIRHRPSTRRCREARRSRPLLEGAPNLQARSPHRRECPRDPQLDYEHEKKLVDAMKADVALFLQLADHGSRQMVEEMLSGEEEDIDWFESQLELIKQVGEAHYLAQQIRGS
jgi:bacterioferritin